MQIGYLRTFLNKQNPRHSRGFLTKSLEVVVFKKTKTFFMKNTFSEENLHDIALHSEVPAASLRSILQSEKMKSVQRIFSTHSFRKACWILKRAHRIAFIRMYKTSADCTTQAQQMLAQAKALNLDWRIRL